MKLKRQTGLFGIAGVVAALLLTGCQLKDRNQVLHFPKPAANLDSTPFVQKMVTMGTAPFDVTYETSGLGIPLPGARMKFEYPNMLASLTVAGIAINAYLKFGTNSSGAPAIVTVCMNAGNLVAQCLPPSKLPADIGGAVSQLQTLLNGLWSFSGGKITQEDVNSMAAQCLNAPAAPDALYRADPNYKRQKLSPDIKLCISTTGVPLFYSNGKLTLAAKSYTNTVSDADFTPVPPKVP